MSLSALFPLAGIITLACAALVWAGARRVDLPPFLQPRHLAPVLMLFSIATTMLAFIEINPVTAQGINFTLAASVAVATMIVQGIYAVGTLRHGIQGLGLFLLPATAVPLLIIPLLPHAHTPNWVHTTSVLETSHLLVSLLAYAILTLAAIHAVMQLLLDRALKRKQLNMLVQALPSLLEIDRHMFAQVWLSTWLVGISILTGLSWQWIEFHHFALLNHKVLLAMFSFGVLVLLLVKRGKAQWPGRVASRVVLSAYGLLLLAYFGVKLINSWLH